MPRHSHMRVLGIGNGQQIVCQQSTGALLVPALPARGGGAGLSEPSIKFCTASRQAERGHHRAALGSEISKTLGQSIVVEAKPGAASGSPRRRWRGDPAATRSWSFPVHTRAWRTFQEREVQRRRRFRMDFDRELLSVPRLRAQRFTVPDTRAIDRCGPQGSRRPEIRLRRRGLDPPHDRRAHRQRDQDQVSARSLSRRGAGNHRSPAGRHRFHCRDVGTDQRAHPLGRVPRAGSDRQDALARLPGRADGRGAGHSWVRGHLLDRACRPRETAQADRARARLRLVHGRRGHQVFGVLVREPAARAHGRRDTRRCGRATRRRTHRARRANVSDR